MKNVDEALKTLTDAIPGLQVNSYTKSAEDTFSMKLEFNGKIVPCEGHVSRLRNIDAVFIEKVRSAIGLSNTQDPLAYFAVPGVLEARQRLESEAVQAITKEFPFDQNVPLAVSRLIEVLQYQSQRIDVSLIVQNYRASRAKI